MLAILDLGRLYKEQDRLCRGARLLRARRSRSSPRRSQAHFQRAATLARASFTPEADCRVPALPRVATRACRRPARAGPRAQGGRRLRRGRRRVRRLHQADAGFRRDRTGASPTSRPTASTTRRSPKWSAARRSEKLSLSRGVNFLFALGKAYEDRGDYDRAWERYRRGKRSSARTCTYDPVQTEVMNDRLVATYTAEFLASLRGSGDPDPAPIFILGLPRSGSTLLEQILASHPQVEGTSRVAVRRAPRDLAQPQSRRRHQLPRGDARARGRNLAALGDDTSGSRGCTDARAPRASSTRCRTTSRTSGSSR